MPLDGNPQDYELDASTRLGRLLILRELLEGQTDDGQQSYCSCLWHAAVTDPRLLAAGLTPSPEPDALIFDPFFGRMSNRYGWMFGMSKVSQKRRILDQLIAEERGSRLKQKDTI